MIDMSVLLEQVPLKPEQEKRISSENARKYARLRNLERQLRREKNLLMVELSDEEVSIVEETIKDDIIDDVPKYLSVAEVSMITGLSPQMVRRNCANGKYEGYQPSGSNGIWFVKSDTFRKDPKAWQDFIERRNELFANTVEVAEAAIELQNENLDETGND